MKSLILDFDGTLADTQHCIVATMKATLETLHLPPADEDAITKVIGLPLRENFTQGAGITDETLVKQCVETYRRLFNDISRKTARLFPNVRQTLQRLHQEGLTLCIATSRGRDSLRMLLDLLDISEYIDYMVADEDVSNKKPAPDMVLRLLELTETEAKEALVVGDTTFDLMMGQRAGCMTCGVTYGNHNRQQLELIMPDFIVDDFAELAEIAGLKK